MSQKTTQSNFSFSASQATADESRAIVVSGRFFQALGTPKKIAPRIGVFKLGSLNSCVQGVVEPAASFVAHVDGRARTIYVGPEEPENAAPFTKCDCRGGAP